MLTVELSAKEVAFLFALFEAPEPPIVEGAIRFIPWFTKRKHLAQIEQSLLERGIVNTGEDGRMRLADSYAAILGLCLGADVATTYEDETGPRAVAFFRSGDAAVMSRQSELVTLRETAEARDSIDWLRHLPGVEPVASGESARRVSMTTQQLEAVMAASASSDQRTLDSLCKDHGWDSDTVVEAAFKFDASTPFFKLTSVRPGIPGMSVMRFSPHSRGVWAFKFVFLGAMDSAEIGWYPYEQLIETALDFAEA